VFEPAAILRRDTFFKENEEFDGMFSTSDQQDILTLSLKFFVENLLQRNKIDNNTHKHIEH
jgi:hypothetical protein